jgi:aminoglycoside phosphotransferase (APT) family kinase protein
VTLETARALVAEQFPQYADLALGEPEIGWDNAMFRLGDRLAIRMPRIEPAVGSLLKERALLHRLGEGWTFPFPRIVADGAPGQGYPWPWSIITWLEGEIAAVRPLSVEGSQALAAAIAQIHEPAPADAPFNDEQSIALHEREAALLPALESLAAVTGPGGERLDAERALGVWEEALAADPPARAVWAHADLHPFNVLADELGGLAGIIDWGDMAACDPAVDLGFAHMLTDAAGMAAALAAYRELQEADPAFEARARGVGLERSVRLAAWHEPLTAACGWRGLGSLGLTVSA